MQITPRKAEIQEMNTVLNADHTSVEDASKAALKRAADLLGERTWYTCVSLSEFGGPLMFGLFATEGAAKKAAKTYMHGADEWYIIPVHSVNEWVARETGQPMPGYCECGHPKSLHRMSGSSYGPCGLSDCGCGKFKAHEWESPTTNTD